NPNNTGAFTYAPNHTTSASAMIAPLLYSKGALAGDIADLDPAKAEGPETVAGHKCLRYSGELHDTYGTGHEVNFRHVTLWIDAESLLVLKVVEEWKPLPGQVSRVIYTFQPQANPKVDEQRFRFAPPSQK